MSNDLAIDLHVDYYCICHVPTFTDLFSSVYTCLFVGVGVRLISSKHGLQSLNVKDFLTYAAKTTYAVMDSTPVRKWPHWNVLDRLGPYSSLKESGGFQCICAVTCARRNTCACVLGRTPKIYIQDDDHAFFCPLVGYYFCCSDILHTCKKKGLKWALPDYVIRQELNDIFLVSMHTITVVPDCKIVVK